MDLNLYQKTIYILLDFIYIISLNIYIRGYTDKRHKRAISIVAVSAICLAMDIIVYFKYSDAYVYLATGIIFTFIMTLAYSREYIKNIVMSVFWIIYSGLAEVFSVYFASVMSGDNVEHAITNNITYTVIMCMLRFFVLISALIFYTVRRKRRGTETIPFYWFVIMFAFAGSIYILESFYSVWYKYAVSGEEYRVLMVAVILMVINVLIFYLYEEQAKHYAMKGEMAQIKNHMDNQRIFYEKEKNMWEQLRKERHDMKNLFIALEGYLREGKYDILAEAFDEKIGSYGSERRKVISGDKNIDIILSYKIAMADNKGIKSDIKCDVKNTIHILPEDLAVLLGNAIDNAIEAAEKSKSPYISVDIKSAKGLCRIIIRNSVDKPVRITKDLNIKTTKSEEGHGWGIKSMKSIVDKYNGQMTMSCDDERFELVIDMIL